MARIKVKKNNLKKASGSLEDISLIKPEKTDGRKLRNKDTYKGGRLSYAQQGKESRVRMSLTIAAEAAKHVYSQKKKTEYLSHTVSRIILEHKEQNQK